jgi:hypothetical protein
MTERKMIAPENSEDGESCLAILISVGYEAFLGFENEQTMYSE